MKVQKFQQRTQTQKPSLKFYKSQLDFQLKHLCPIYWAASQSKELQSAQEFLKAHKIDKKEMHTNTKTLLLLKKCFPKFWEALKSGQLKQAHKLIHQAGKKERGYVNVSEKNLLSTLSTAAKANIAAFFAQSDMRTKQLQTREDRVKLIRDLSTTCPLYFEALKHGEVSQAKLKINSGACRGELCVLKKFWDAFEMGEVHRGESIISAYVRSKQ